MRIPVHCSSKILIWCVVSHSGERPQPTSQEDTSHCAVHVVEGSSRACCKEKEVIGGRQTVWAGQLEDGGDVVPNVKEEMLDDALIFSRSVGIPESGEPDSE